MDTSYHTCGNCIHWTRTAFTPGHGICAVAAIEADAGEGVIILLSARSHCLNHQAAFEPTEDFILQQKEESIPEYIRNGVIPGIDFPYTI